MNPIDTSLQYLDAMRQVGIEPDCPIIPDGKLHRFRDWLDKPGKLNGWYVLFPDYPPAGAFGCWRRGIKEKWSSVGAAGIVTLDKRLATLPELTAKQDEYHQRDHDTWKSAKPANGKHQYQLMKNVKSHGIRYLNGALLVPVCDAAGRLYGLQRIYSNGSKRFTFGTDKKGHFHLVGTPRNKLIYIAEGYTTAATIHEITGEAVVVAFDAGNLLPVAEALRAAYPDHEVIICADDDRWTPDNTGLLKARAAAAAVGGSVVWPQFSNPNSRGTDFNDIFLEEGPESVSRSIRVAGGDYV